MKKAMLVAMLLASIAALSGCGGDVVSPLSDNYNQADLFKVEVIQDFGNGSGLVQVYWLAAKMDQGNHPFSFGPIDNGDWGDKNVTYLSVKTVDGKYYTYTKNVVFGKPYNIGAGLDYPKGWLSPNQQSGSKYYNPVSETMAFTANADMTITPGW